MRIIFNPLAPGVPKEKQTRAPQPNRAPPNSSRLKRVKRDNGSAGSVSAARGNHNGSDEKTEHGRKMEAQAAAFDAKRLFNVAKYQESASRRFTFRDELNKAVQKVYQETAARVAEAQRNQHPCARHNPSALFKLETREVAIIATGRRFFVGIDRHRCSRCDAIITVHPYDLDCCPTTATDYCLTWVPISRVYFFQDLNMINGLSCEGKSFWLNVCFPI